MTRRLSSWGTLMGILWYINPIYAFGGLVYFAVAWVAIKELRCSMKQWTNAFLIMFGLAVPPIWWLVLNALQPPVDTNMWLSVIHVTQGYHVFPLTWSFRLTLLAAAFWVAIVVLSWKFRSVAGLLYKLSFAWAGVALFWVVLAFVGAYWIQHRILISLQPIRSTDFWYASAAVVIICLTCCGLSDTLEKRQRLVSIMLSMLWGGGFAIWRIKEAKLDPMLFLLQCSALLLAAPVFIAYSFYCQKESLTTNQVMGKLAYIYLIIAVIVGALSAFRRGNIMATNDLPAYAAIGDWAKQSTSIGSVFLVPLEWSHFRLVSHRPVFVLKKDAGLVLAAPSYTKHWVERLTCLGFNPVPIGEQALRERFYSGRPYERVFHNTALWTELDRSVTDETIERIKARYRLDYWVLSAERTTRFPEVFRYRGWKVVRVSDDVGTSRPPPPRPSPSGKATGDSPTRAGPPSR
jgi:hypothetical protein